MLNSIAKSPVSMPLRSVCDLLLLGSLGVAARAAAEPVAQLLVVDAEPDSMDDLFGSDEPADSAAASEEEATGQSDEEAEPGSVDALFAEEPQQTAKAGDSAPSRLTGFFENKIAYTYEDPDHWSLARNTVCMARSIRAACSSGTRRRAAPASASSRLASSARSVCRPRKRPAPTWKALA